MEPFSVVAPTSSADGYGYSAEALILSAVNDHGADIAFVEHDWRDTRFSNPEFLKLREHESIVQDRNICITYFLPFALAQTRFRSRFTIGMSMWETDRLPRAWAGCARLADAYIVPSQHSADIFRAWITCPIEVVPFGTDSNLYVYHDRSHREDDSEFLFLMAGMLHYRKGLEFALKAFREEFSNGEHVKLVLKTRKGFVDAGPEFTTLNDPRVEVINVDYQRYEMAQLYHNADCFLAPSRGEGSGLTPRDAMATGLPTILTNWSGLTELADERYSYPIDVECLEPAPQDCSSYQFNVTGGGPIGNFAKPSVESLRAHMRYVYENRQLAYQKGKEASNWMKREFSWDICSYRWLRAIESLSGVKV